MDATQLIPEINKILKASWTKNQIASGKWIEVQWTWVGFIGKIVHAYQECGWDIKKQVEIGPKGRRMWLVFINPRWADGKAKELPN